MENNKLNGFREQRRRNDGFAFFRGFLRSPDVVGSIVPSSRFLERRILEAADVARSRQVVELGPGTGGTTRAILDALPGTAKLLAIEIDPDFVALLRHYADPRMIVHNGSAEHIEKALAEYGLPSPDVVISGIPFSTMPPARGRAIIRSVWSSLAPGGQFVAYQFRGRVAQLGTELLGSPEVEVELFNVPPMRVYCWRKPELQEEVATA